MTDEEVREFLAGLSPDPAGQPEGYVAIFRHAIEQRGGDLNAIDSWMQRHGATTMLTPKPIRIHTGQRRDFVPYYQVPITALAAGE